MAQVLPKSVYKDKPKHDTNSIKGKAALIRTFFHPYHATITPPLSNRSLFTPDLDHPTGWPPPHPPIRWAPLINKQLPCHQAALSAFDVKEFVDWGVGAHWARCDLSTNMCAV